MIPLSYLAKRLLEQTGLLARDVQVVYHQTHPADLQGNVTWPERRIANWILGVRGLKQ